jgi:hypothetical protein
MSHDRQHTVPARPPATDQHTVPARPPATDQHTVPARARVIARARTQNSVSARASAIRTVSARASAIRTVSARASAIRTVSAGAKAVSASHTATAAAPHSEAAAAPHSEAAAAAEARAAQTVDEDEAEAEAEAEERAIQLEEEQMEREEQEARAGAARIIRVAEEITTRHPGERLILGSRRAFAVAGETGVAPHGDPDFQLTWHRNYAARQQPLMRQILAGIVDQFAAERGAVDAEQPARTQACGMMFGAAPINRAEALNSLPLQTSESARMCAVSLVRSKYARLFFGTPRVVSRGGAGAVAIIDVDSPGGGARDFATVKIPLNPDADSKLAPYHEAYIGLSVVNAFRNDVPNFMLTYGVFECAAPIVHDGNVVTWCADHLPANQTVYTVNEYVRTPADRDLKDVKTGIATGKLAPAAWCGILAQVVCALDYAHARADFTHHDMHTANVMLRETRDARVGYEVRETASSPAASPRVSVSVATGGVHAVIIDFGQSRCNTPVGIVGPQMARGDVGIERARSNIMIDVYKFVAFSLMQFHISNTATPSQMAHMLALLRPFVSFAVTGATLAEQFLNGQPDPGKAPFRSHHSFPWTPASDTFRVAEYLERVQSAAAALGDANAVSVGDTGTGKYRRATDASADHARAYRRDVAAYAAALDHATAFGMSRAAFEAAYGAPLVDEMREPAVAYLRNIATEVANLAGAQAPATATDSNRGAVAVLIADKMLNFALMHRAARDIGLHLPDFKALDNSALPFEIIENMRTRVAPRITRRVTERLASSTDRGERRAMLHASQLVKVFLNLYEQVGGADSLAAPALPSN